MVNQAGLQHTAVVTLGAFERFVTGVCFNMILQPTLCSASMIAALNRTFEGTFHSMPTDMFIEATFEWRSEHTVLTFERFSIGVNFTYMI